MQLAQQKGPITCEIPGFSILRTVRPFEEQKSVADINPQAGMFFKSPTGSVHAVVSTNETFGFVNTIRVGSDSSVRYGRILFTQSIHPDSGISIYKLPNLDIGDTFRRALDDSLAHTVLKTLFAHKEHLITVAPTLGRERLYSAYLENFENSLESLSLTKIRSDSTPPAIGLTTHYGGIVEGTIAFGWPMGDRSSVRSEAIRMITADTNIRIFPDYLRKLEAVVRAAGVFNAIIQAQHALPSTCNF
jgi:hypothetical protein